MDEAKQRSTPVKKLCIGGPYSGQRVALLYGARFYAPAPAAAQIDAKRSPGLSYPVSAVAYREENIRTPDGDVSFFVPDGQSPLDTLTMLLDAFERLSALEAKRVVEGDEDTESGHGR